MKSLLGQNTKLQAQDLQTNKRCLLSQHDNRKQFTNATEAESLVKVGVINNLAHSLWEQIILMINDEKVTENSPYYAYKAILETLLSYDKEAEKSVLRLSCFKKDQGNVDATHPIATHVNHGLRERSAIFEGGKRVTMITCHRIDLCLQPRYIPDQCKILLELSPNKDSFVLMSDKDDARFKLKVHSCTLNLHFSQLFNNITIHSVIL